MTTWASGATFYHIYPLGMLGAPADNPGHGDPVPRLRELIGWTGHLRDLGVDAVYLGPVFESSRHGYDTTDHFMVDRRLGTDADLRAVVDHFHGHGIRVILDAVYHHVGREHFAFRDLREHGEASVYRTWFHGLDFSQTSPLGDPFTYDGWNGVLDLVKLDVTDYDVREHLFAATRHWFEAFGIDGLRLDAADVLDRDFQRDLAAVVREIAPDAWLLGEVIHGDYREWAGPGRLDATTNYALWKGLYSSFNDRNMHEIAWTLGQQSGPDGLYRDLDLYTFADNHDVDRVASLLRDPRHLYPLYLTLFTVPGIPSFYYGSEWGIRGVKSGSDDGPLRPRLRFPPRSEDITETDLAGEIARLARIRRNTPALSGGDYRQLHVAAEQLAFVRRQDDAIAVVAVNAADAPVDLTLDEDLPDGTDLVDALDGSPATVRNGQIHLPDVPPRWGRILISR